MFQSDEAFHQEKKFKGLKDYILQIIEDQDRTKGFLDDMAINGKQSKKQVSKKASSKKIKSGQKGTKVNKSGQKGTKSNKKNKVF